MATSSAWLSILVKRGQDIVKPRTVVKCSWEDAFGVLLDKLDMPETTIDKVQIATNEKFTDPVHVVPIDAPPSAFDVLMAASREIVLPSKLTPPEGKQLRKDQQLYNDLLGQLNSTGIGWRACSLDTGVNFVSKLAQTHRQ